MKTKFWLALEDDRKYCVLKSSQGSKLALPRLDNINTAFNGNCCYIWKTPHNQARLE